MKFDGNFYRLFEVNSNEMYYRRFRHEIRIVILYKRF